MLTVSARHQDELINGYPARQLRFLAMERGEPTAIRAMFYSALSSARPNWLRDKEAKAIVQYGPERLRELPDVPFVTDLLTNEDDKLLMRAASAPAGCSSGRPAVDAARRSRRSGRRHAQGVGGHLQGRRLPGRGRKARLIVNAPGIVGAAGGDRTGLCHAVARGREVAETQRELPCAGLMVGISRERRRSRARPTRARSGARRRL